VRYIPLGWVFLFVCLFCLLVGFVVWLDFFSFLFITCFIASSDLMHPYVSLYHSWKIAQTTAPAYCVLPQDFSGQCPCFHLQHSPGHGSGAQSQQWAQAWADGCDPFWPTLGSSLGEGFVLGWNSLGWNLSRNEWQNSQWLQTEQDFALRVSITILLEPWFARKTHAPESEPESRALLFAHKQKQSQLTVPEKPVSGFPFSFVKCRWNFSWYQF